YTPNPPPPRSTLFPYTTLFRSQRDFKTSNAAVMQALADYKTFLQHTLLPASNGDYALGADTYARALAANDMVDVPLPRLLEIARSEEHTSELQSRSDLVCRLLL